MKRFLYILSALALLCVAGVCAIAIFGMEKKQLEANREQTRKAREARWKKEQENGKSSDVEDAIVIEEIEEQNNEQQTPETKTEEQ